MSQERRKGKPPIPDDFRLLLSLDQKLALKELESFGWRLNFVRRPLFQEPRIIMHNPDTGRYSVIESDGTVDHNPLDINVREEDH